MKSKTLILKLTIIIAFLSVAILANNAYAQQYGAFYNACVRGPICDLGQQFYSPGDFVYDETIEFPAAELKIIPHPYYEEYRDFTCKADECLAGVSETTYCASGLDLDPDNPLATGPIGEIPAIRICTAITLPHCNLSYCQTNPTEPLYCEIGAIRPCDGNLYGPPGWYECTQGDGWVYIHPDYLVEPYPTGECYDSPHPVRRCFNGQLGVPGSGRWINREDRPDEQGRCEEMLTSVNAAFTPGHVQTYTPYLFDIWQNTVNNFQTIFTPFRTALSAETEDWPGESIISYDFTNDFAEAGYPLTMHAGSDARIYFRYLGYIHCAKENLLQKLSSKFYQEPYVYYDARCDNELW
jgi:hypothetical protein